MDCRKAEQLLHAWIDGELDESDRTALMAHLSECRACARKLAEYRRLDTLLDQLDAQTKVPAGLYARIMDAVSREAAPKKSALTRWSRWAASAAAVLLLGVTVGVLWRAGIWPAPVGDSARYKMTQEDAAPMEAPAAEMAPDAEIMMQVEEADRGIEQAAGEPAEGADLRYNGVPFLEATWTVETLGGDHVRQGGADAIASFSGDHGLTVVETGPDWISVQWETDEDKEALLAFLEENGALTVREDGTVAPRILVIYIQ